MSCYGWPAACSCSVMSSTITEPLATTMEEPLARLVAFEPTTFPVLSVYLNTQPDQHGRTPDAAPYLHREFKALARTWAPGSPERHSFDRDVERIVSYATDKIDPAANGVAIFACWGAEEFFEAIQLTTPVSDNRVYAYNQPHLYHLAHLDEQYPRYAAVLTDTNTARIFVFGLGPGHRRGGGERQESSSGQGRWMVAGPLPAACGERAPGARQRGHGTPGSDCPRRQNKSHHPGRRSGCDSASSRTTASGNGLHGGGNETRYSCFRAGCPDRHSRQATGAGSQDCRGKGGPADAAISRSRIGRSRARRRRSKPWPTDKSKNCSSAARSRRAIPSRRKCEPSSRRRSPIQREERRAKNRGKRPCPIYW
jgi:hypothetical protein